MFKNMNIGMRLGLGFGVLLVLLFVLSIIGYWGVHAVSNTTVHMLEGDANISEHAARARANVNALRRYEKDYFINIGDATKEAQLFEGMDRRARQRHRAAERP